MIESDASDFAMEGPGPAPGPADVPAAPPPPVIVIEHRSGGAASKFLPPLLILLVALAITSYQRRAQVIRPISTRKSTPRATVPEPPPAAKADPAPDGATPAPPVEVAESPVPTRAEAAEAPKDKDRAEEKAPAEAVAEAPAFRSPFALDTDDGLKPVDAADPARAADGAPAVEPIVAGGAPAAGDAVSKDDILRDIQREATEIDADRKNTNELKAHAKETLLAETLKSIQEKRVPFRNELRRANRELGGKAGPEIDRLCDEYGRETPAEVHALFTRMNRRAGIAHNLDLPDLILRMRQIGLPEPVILDWICTNKIHKSLNSPGGPRTEDEVRIRGAMLLLKYPVQTARKTSATAPAAPGNR